MTCPFSEIWIVAGSTPTGWPAASVTETYTVTCGNLELSTCVMRTCVPPVCASAVPAAAAQQRQDNAKTENEAPQSVHAYLFS